MSDNQPYGTTIGTVVRPDFLSTLINGLREGKTWAEIVRKLPDVLEEGVGIVDANGNYNSVSFEDINTLLPPTENAQSLINVGNFNAAFFGASNAVAGLSQLFTTAGSVASINLTSANLVTAFGSKKMGSSLS